MEIINSRPIVAVPPEIENIDSIQFDTSYAGPASNTKGMIYWNDVDQTLNIVVDENGDSVILQTGQEMLAVVYNNTGGIIANGTVGYASGSFGEHPTIEKAQADDITTCFVQGVATQAIADSVTGLFSTFGLVRGVNTSAFDVGDILYLSTSVAGGITKNVPTSGYNVIVGRVLKKDATDGIFFTYPRPQPAFGDIEGGNYIAFDYRGRIELAGTAKVTRQTQFTFNYSQVTGQGKPTLVNRGIFYGFSLPIYAADNEELFACSCMPGDWDGTTDPHVILSGWLDTANTDKNFNMQVSAEVYDPSSNDVVPVTTNDYTIETATGTAVQYTSFKLDFTLDASAIGLLSGDPLGIRIRRIAASADEITGEFVIEGAVLSYTIDKLGE